MSYVTRINPFGGILCVPYYYMWILIAISWIIIWIKLVWLCWIDKYQDRNTFLSQKTKICNKLRISTKLQLTKLTTVDNESLPSEIITIIMDMLPTIHDNWYEHAPWEKRKLNVKWHLPVIALYIYPIARFVANLGNFITIMVQYGKWYHSHSNVSNWDKYCAFIITCLYMPNFLGRGSNSLWMQVVADAIEFSHALSNYIRTISWVNVLVEIMVVAAFVIVSFPIFITGIFVYLPTTILGLIIGFAIWFICFRIGAYFHDKWHGPPDYIYYHDIGIMSGVLMSTSFGALWFFIVIIVPSMELYAGGNWVEAYRIGFFAEYCNKDDYFAFNKWSEYEWNIQLLIVSWFIF